MLRMYLIKPEEAEKEHKPSTQVDKQRTREVRLNNLLRQTAVVDFDEL